MNGSSHRATVTVAILGAGAVTTIVAVVPQLRFAYEVAGMRIVIDTAASMIAALLALLIYGRVREKAQLDLVILVFALGLVATTNLFLSAIASALADGDPTDFTSWAPAAGRLIAAVAFLVSTLVPTRAVRRDRPLAAVIALSVLAITAAIGLVIHSSTDVLPAAVDQSLSPLRSGRPLIAGHPLTLSVQLVLLIVFAATTVGFVRRHDTTGDDLYGWLAAFAGLSALARLHYLLFPSIYSNWIYTGDFLRLGSLAVLMGGSVREIRSYWSAKAEAAVSAERRRMARDFHDGIAQELAYISSLTTGPAAAGAADMDRISAASRRALIEARLAIAALRSAEAETLADAVGRVARDAGHRFGLDVHLDMRCDLASSASVSEAAQRIVYEAIANATRHGEASAVRVELSDGDGSIRLHIGDDGKGFTPSGSGEPTGGYGLISMRERATAVGGRFEISSDRRGTRVEVTFPCP